MGCPKRPTERFLNTILGVRDERCKKGVKALNRKYIGQGAGMHLKFPKGNASYQAPLLRILL
jgi:hypothetical protein